MYPACPPTLCRSRRSRLLTRTALSGALLVASTSPALAGQTVTPWIQQYYGGGSNPVAPTAIQNVGSLDIHINAPRTVTDWDSNGYGVSNFNPTTSNAYNIYFGSSGTSQRDWIAIFRSTGRIEVDGPLTSYLGDGITKGGNVWLLGAGGVLFTQNAQVDVGGLLAASARFSDLSGFLGGATQVHFDQPSANPYTSVQIDNGATITGNGSLLAFVGPYVTSAPNASITGFGGTSILYGSASKYTVSFAPSSSGIDLLSFEVDADGGSSGYGTPLSLAAPTTANGGNIYVAAVNGSSVASAVINATGTLTAHSATSSDGNIILSAGSSISSGLPSSSLADGQLALKPGNIAADGNVFLKATGVIDPNYAVAGGTQESNIVALKDAVIQSGRSDKTVSAIGGVYLTSLTVGDDLLVSAANGGIDFASVRFAGMVADDASGVPGFDNAGDGNQMLLTTTQPYANPTESSRIAIGGPRPQPGGTVAVSGKLEGQGNFVINSAGGVQVEVQGDVNLTSITAGSQGSLLKTIDIKTHSGSIAIGSANATSGNLLVDAIDDDPQFGGYGGVAIVGTGIARQGQAQDGVIAVHGRTSALLTSGTADSDVYVVASGGDATAGTIVAGDDIYVVANGGDARLTSGTVDNTTGDAADIDSNPGLSANVSMPYIADFNEEQTAGRVIQVSGQDSYLGLGTGGASFTNVALDKTVNVIAQHSAVIDTPLTSVLLSSVQAGYSIDITAANGNLVAASLSTSDGPLSLTARSAQIGTLNIVGNAEVTATAGDLTIGNGSDLNISGDFTASALGNLTVGDDGNGTISPIYAYNGTVSLTSGGSMRTGDVISGGDLTIIAPQGLIGGYLSGGQALAITATGGDILTSGAYGGSGATILGRSIQIDYFSADGDANLTSTVGDIILNPQNSTYVYGKLTANANGNLTVGSHVSGYGYGGYGYGSGYGFGIYDYYDDVSLTAGGAISVDEIQTGGALTLQGGSLTATGAFYAGGNVTVSVGGDISLQDVIGAYGGGGVGTLAQVAQDQSPVVDVSLTSTGGNIVVAGGASADGSLSIVANNGLVQVDTATADGNLTLSGRTLNVHGFDGMLAGTVNLQASAGDIELNDPIYASYTSINAGGDVTIGAGGYVSLNNVTSGGLIHVSGGSGAVTANSLATTGAVDSSSIYAKGSSVTVQALHATGDVTAIAADALSLGGNGGLATGRDLYLTGGSFSLPTSLGTVRDLNITAVGADFTTPTSFSPTRDLTILAAGAIFVPGATAGGDIRLTGATVTTTGALNATNDIVVQSSGLLHLAALTAGRDISLAGGSLISTDNYQAGRDVTATIGGSASFNDVSAGDDITLTSTGALTAATLTSTGAGSDNENDGSNIRLAGASVAAINVAAANDFVATAATGALSLATSGGQITAGRDIQLSGGSVILPAVSARDLSIAVTGGDFTAPSGLSASRDMTLSASGKLTLASLMVTRDLTLSAGAGGIATSHALDPGRDLTVASEGDASLGTVHAGDDIRVVSQGKVSADLLFAGGGVDSEPDGYNIYVNGSSTQVGSAQASGTVSITPAPPTPTPPVTPTPTPTPPVTPTPTPTPTPSPPASPWVQVYYGGANAAAPTSSASSGLLDIYLNAPRTITDWGSTNGVSDFHPSTAQGVHFHFGQRDWIAIVRSGGQIQVDGELKTLIGNTSTVGGNLWLMSGAGVLFGSNARVDVGGLLATSASFSSMADALDPSKTSFGFDVAGSGGITIAAGAVLNGRGGMLAFMGPSVTSAAGSQVNGGSGTSVLYAATDTGTIDYAPATSGDLGFGSANGDFASGAVALSGSTNVGGSATVGGRSVGVASLTAGGAVTMLATGGDINAASVTTQANANFDATGKVAVGTLAAAGDVSVTAGDLDVATRLTANSLTAQSRGGNVALGGTDGTSAGFRVTGAEMARLTLTRGASFYAGLTGGGSQAAQATGSQHAQAVVRGDMVIGDMGYDPSNLPELDLYADSSHSVSVTGAVRPTTSGGIIQIGDTLASSDWRPSSINVSGSFGSAIIYNEKCFDQVVSIGELRLLSSGNIIFGSSTFQTAVANTPAASIDVARNSPAVASTANDQLFAVTQKLTLAAPGKIVQQNTAKTTGPTVGLLLANQDNVTDTVVSVSGGPTAFELFGSLIDATGTLRSGINAAAASELRVSGATKANYRFNGCAIATAANCSILDTSAVPGVQKGSSIRKELDDQDGTGGN